MNIFFRGLLISAVLLSGCAFSPANTTPPSPTIVTSFSILADITSRIVGDTMPVVSIVAADNDTHAFEPSPADAARVADATVIVTLGLEFEGWFDDIYTASGSTAPVFVASTPLTPLPAQDHADETHADETHADENESHGEFDPHVWQDVSNVSTMVGYLATELSTQFPEHARTFARNAAEYQAELAALDQEIIALSQEIPAERRLLITNHDTFGYFAARYGYTVVDSVLGSVSTEGGDPGATQIAALAEVVQRLGIRTIFVENTSNTQISENLAKEVGITLAPPLYTDALGGADSSGATYVAMMRYNIQTIHSALMP